ncbi:hypothetical protein FPOA_06405 [Fusarium poae]|uniref:SNF2 N-terminal domain-containing protein n=1 Tax=Fusarium poae TaxID=36050 RepID=A0A1B8AZL5_FUSPO|nr:hypothetical protein FPOA_06405 [Fusarium poae]
MPSSNKNSRGVDGDAPKELKRVNAKDISRNDITILDKGRRGDAYAVLVTYYPVSPHIARHLDLLICDEGQYIRRVSGSYMNLLQLFKWERLLFISYVSSGQSLWYLRTYLCHPDYDSYEKNNDIVSGTGEELGTTKGIFSDEFIQSVESDAGLSEALQALSKSSCEGSLKPWMLSAALLQDCSRDLTWGVNLGSMVVKPLLQFIYIRRTMKTALALPGNHGVSYPSDGMLPSVIRVEECPFSPDDPDAALVKKLGQTYADSLFSTLGSANLTEYTQAAQSSDMAKDNSQEVNLNFGEHRAGVITAFDPRTVQMLNPAMSAFFGNNPCFHSGIQTSLPLHSHLKYLGPAWFRYPLDTELDLLHFHFSSTVLSPSAQREDSSADCVSIRTPG